MLFSTLSTTGECLRTLQYAKYYRGVPVSPKPRSPQTKPRQSPKAKHPIRLHSTALGPTASSPGGPQSIVRTQTDPTASLAKWHLTPWSLGTLASMQLNPVALRDRGASRFAAMRHGSLSQKVSHLARQQLAHGVRLDHAERAVGALRRRGPAVTSCNGVSPLRLTEPCLPCAL